MINVDKSKRSFFKKAAVAVGFVAAAGYLRNLISSHANSILVINENSEHEVLKLKKAWLQKQWVPMTDNEKKQMLDEILEIHNNNHV